MNQKINNNILLVMIHIHILLCVVRVSASTKIRCLKAGKEKKRKQDEVSVFIYENQYLHTCFDLNCRLTNQSDLLQSAYANIFISRHRLLEEK